jgi:hypothetical protein
VAQAANIDSATATKTTCAECLILTIVISLRGRRAATLLDVEKVHPALFQRRVRYLPGFAGSSACCA